MLPNGGILADEQGLGKTIQVTQIYICAYGYIWFYQLTVSMCSSTPLQSKQIIALMLANPGKRPNVGKRGPSGKYISNATLVVAPLGLLSQVKNT